MKKIAYVTPVVFAAGSSMLFAGQSFVEAVAAGAIAGATAGAVSVAVAPPLIGTPAATAGAVTGVVAGVVVVAVAGAQVWAWNALFGPPPPSK